MQESHLEILITLARAGLGVYAKNAPAHQLCEGASAIAAAEGQLVVLRSQSEKKKDA